MEDNLFLSRLENSNVFTEEEKIHIINEKKIYEKCYYLGILDGLNT